MHLLSLDSLNIVCELYWKAALRYIKESRVLLTISFSPQTIIKVLLCLPQILCSTIFHDIPLLCVEAALVMLTSGFITPHRPPRVLPPPSLPAPAYNKENFTADGKFNCIRIPTIPLWNAAPKHNRQEETMKFSPEKNHHPHVTITIKNVSGMWKSVGQGNAPCNKALTYIHSNTAPLWSGSPRAR